MTEDEAQAWLRDQFGDQVFQALRQFTDDLLSANATQNLISKASESIVWTRHILDSAQLAGLAPSATNWLDIGSGAGLPGVVLAIITDRPVLLVEPRRKRADFLRHIVERLELTRCDVRQTMVEQIASAKFEAITARAFAPLSHLFSSTVRLTTPSTIWVLPKGRTAEQELAAAQEAWHGMFHVEQSLTDPDARIIVATGVHAR